MPVPAVYLLTRLAALAVLWVPAMEHLYQKRLQDGAADRLSFVLVYVSGQATWLEHSYVNGEWAEGARCW